MRERANVDYDDTRHLVPRVREDPGVEEVEEHDPDSVVVQGGYTEREAREMEQTEEKEYDSDGESVLSDHMETESLFEEIVESLREHDNYFANGTYFQNKHTSRGAMIAWVPFFLCVVIEVFRFCQPPMTTVGRKAPAFREFKTPRYRTRLISTQIRRLAHRKKQLTFDGCSRLRGRMTFSGILWKLATSRPKRCSPHLLSARQSSSKTRMIKRGYASSGSFWDERCTSGRSYRNTTPSTMRSSC